MVGKGSYEDLPYPENPFEDQRHVVLAVASTMMGLSVLLVSLRLYVRQHMTKSLWWDDWMITAAAVSAAC